MKKLRIVSAGVAILFALVGCQKAPTTPSSQELSKFSVQFPLDNAPEAVQSITGELTREDFDPVTREFTLSPDSAVADFGSIAVGTWHLAVTAYSAEKNPLYHGETDVTIFGGQENNIHLELNPVTGNLHVVVTWGDGNPPPESLSNYIYIHTQWTGPTRSIYRYNLTTNELTQLTGEMDAAYPLYLSNLGKICFLSRENYDTKIWLMNTDGSNRMEWISSIPVVNFMGPRYSTVNNKIFFYTYGTAGTDRLASIDYDGSNFQYLTDDDNYNDHSPAPHPSANELLFVSDRDEVTNIYRLNLETQVQSQVTTNDGSVRYSLPRWKEETGFYFLIRNDNSDTSGIYYYRFATESPELIVQPSGLYIRSYDISPDGSTIAMTCTNTTADSDTRNLYLYRIETEEWVQKTFTELQLNLARWFSAE